MNLFDTLVLMGIVQDLRLPQQGLAARYFTGIVTSDSESIGFDLDNKPRRMSPFVSPLVAGKLVKSRGYRTDTFKPAYVKDKRTFHPTRAIKRTMGERIGGGDLSPQQRMQILLVQDMQDQLDMITRRLEWMAAKALMDGKVTVVGEDYPSVEVDFGRSASHTITPATNADKWSDAAKKPLDDLQDWSDLMVKDTGVGISDVVMTVDVWKVFRNKDDIRAKLDRFRSNTTLTQDAHNREGLVFQGVIDQFNIYTYSGWAVDPTTNTESAYLDAGTVLCLAAPDLVEGVQHFGAILDVENLQAVPYYAKSWVEEDPSMRYLLMQSAPLLVPHRVNATLKAKVL